MDENANRFPPETVAHVAERLYHVLIDLNSTGHLIAKDVSPEMLKDNKGQLHKSSALVADTESKLKAQREDRDVDSDKTYATMVKLLGLCQVVYGTRSIEYKRARAEFDELRPKRRRNTPKNDSQNGGPTPPPTSS